jgi:hypothetical protein
MINAYFECRYISQFKGLIDVINIEIEKTKKRLREEMLVQFQLEHHSVIGS